MTHSLFFTSSDEAIEHLIKEETSRQREHLILMAGENYSSQAVLSALGSSLANKYAEGYPGHRLHADCEVVDKVEGLAIDRAKVLFEAEYVNVQPYSGTSALLAAYWVLLQPGDSVLSMSTASGGHFSQGSPVNISGTIFDFIHYGTRSDSGLLDYDAVLDLARKVRPRAIVCGANAYPRTIDYEAFRMIADSVGAYLIVDCCPTTGLIAGGALSSPIRYADVVAAASHKTLRGPKGGFLLSGADFAESLSAAVYPFFQGGPHMNTIAAKAVAFHEAESGEFRSYAKQTVSNAHILASTLIEEGFPVVTGGTDNHLVIVDTTRFDASAISVRARCLSSGIAVDVVEIPKSRNSEGGAGLRIGTAAVTTLGMKENEMEIIGRILGSLIRNETRSKAAEVSEIMAAFSRPGQNAL
ncbi:serine hydroxymethyltransferase [Streptomyces erythrochromogenes]|uniref:serine hydroxymethyltransferase n=1 Tax=Streptomyces erythrochromogenes TaxID=285574 RepID=UPI003689D43F